MKPLFLLAIVLLLLGACSTTNWVQDEDPPYLVQAGKMVGRGLGNLISSPLEILNQPLHRAHGDGFGEWMAGFMEGIVAGVAYCGARAVAGVADLVTFVAPHRALIEPEFITFPGKD